MTSQVDPTVFPDNQPVDKKDLREQFEVAANEITALQQKVALPRRMAFDDNVFTKL